MASRNPEDILVEGSAVAIITPFVNDSVDESALRTMVNWQIEQGTKCIVPVGTTGESPTLTPDEHRRVIELVVKEAAGRVHVMAGAGSNNTREALEYHLEAAKLGADSALHVCGYYNRPSQEGIYQHFKVLSEASDLPIVVYNIPPRAVIDISADTMARIASLEHVAGVKDATCDLNRPVLEALQIKKPFAWLSGEDGTAVAYNAAGGNGCISVSANIAPALCAQMQNACIAGDFVSARAIQKRLMPLHQSLFAEPSPAGVKYATSLLGLCGSECRLPVVELSPESKAGIKKAMDGLGLLQEQAAAVELEV